MRSRRLRQTIISASTLVGFTSAPLPPASPVPSDGFGRAYDAGRGPPSPTRNATDAALLRAAFCGLPVVRVARGNTGGFCYPSGPFFIAGSRT